MAATGIGLGAGLGGGALLLAIAAAWGVNQASKARMRAAENAAAGNARAIDILAARAIQDDAWALDFYYAHKDDTAAQLVHAVLTNTQMWDQDLTQISGLEAAVLADLEKIRTEGAEAAYKSCL